MPRRSGCSRSRSPVPAKSHITDLVQVFVGCPPAAAHPSSPIVPLQDHASTVDLLNVGLVCPVHPVTPVRIDCPIITPVTSTLSSCTCVRVCVYAVDRRGWNVHRFHIAPMSTFGNLTAYWAHTVNMPRQFVHMVFWNDDTPTVDADLLLDCLHVSPSRVLRLFSYATALAHRHWNVLQELTQTHGWKRFSDHPPALRRLTGLGARP